MFSDSLFHRGGEGAGGEGVLLLSFTNPRRSPGFALQRQVPMLRKVPLYWLGLLVVLSCPNVQYSIQI